MLYEIFIVSISSLGSIMIFIGVAFTIYGFKYRRDINLNLRKDIHFEIMNNYNHFINNYNNEKIMKAERYDYHLISIIGSPISRRRSRLRKNLFIKKHVILEQMKNYQTIKDDFKLNDSISFNNFRTKKKKYQDLGKDRDTLIRALFLIAITLYSDSIELINYDEKFKPLIKDVKSLRKFSKRASRKLSKSLENGNKK